MNTCLNITQYYYKATYIYRLLCALFSDQPSDGWESKPDAGKSPPMVAETQAHRDHPHTNLQSRFAFVKPLVFKIVFLSPVCRNGKMKVFASSIEQGQSEIQEFILVSIESTSILTYLLPGIRRVQLEGWGSSLRASPHARHASGAFSGARSSISLLGSVRPIL